jgi:serine/threonine-protein kinase HipA
MRKALVYLFDQPAGEVWEDETGFHFRYLPEHLSRADAHAVSLTLPLAADTYSSEMILPFFDGLIPEGWLLDIAGAYWKINPRDRVGLLFACCRDCIGAVSIYPLAEENIQ